MPLYGTNVMRYIEYTAFWREMHLNTKQNISDTFTHVLTNTAYSIMMRIHDRYDLLSAQCIVVMRTYSMSECLDV